MYLDQWKGIIARHEEESPVPMDPEKHWRLVQMGINAQVNPLYSVPLLYWVIGMALSFVLGLLVALTLRSPEILPLDIDGKNSMGPFAMSIPQENQVEQKTVRVMDSKRTKNNRGKERKIIQVVAIEPNTLDGGLPLGQDLDTKGSKAEIVYEQSTESGKNPSQNPFAVSEDVQTFSDGMEPNSRIADSTAYPKPTVKYAEYFFLDDLPHKPKVKYRFFNRVEDPTADDIKWVSWWFR